MVKQLIRGVELADDLLWVVALDFHGASPGQVWPVGNSHKGWFCIWGPRDLDQSLEGKDANQSEVWSRDLSTLELSLAPLQNVPTLKQPEKDKQ